MRPARSLTLLCILMYLCSSRAQSSESNSSEYIYEASDVRDGSKCGDVVSNGTEACVWTSAQFKCEDECSNKCLLADNHHLRYIAALFELKAFEAVECSIMAELVSVATLEMDLLEAEENLNTIPHFNSSRNLMAFLISNKVNRSTQLDQAIARGLKTATNPYTFQQGRECPTADDIDRIKPALERAAHADVERNSDNPSFEEDKPHLWIEDILFGFNKDPESLKSLFEYKCETKIMNEAYEPLKSMYLTLQHPDTYPLALDNVWQDERVFYSNRWHADEDPRAGEWPSTVTACRPKSEADERIVNIGRPMAAACRDVVQQIEQGACLKEFHAELLVSECFQVIADVIGADDIQASRLFADLSSIHEACASATTEESCSAVEPTAEMRNLTDTLVELKVKAEESMRNQSISMACFTCIFGTAAVISFMAVLMMMMMMQL